jgi:hypothetical protein
MKKKILIVSIIAVALLTLLSFSNVVGYNVVKNTREEIITDEYDFEYCKDYLFETFVEIANNEDVRDLINHNYQNPFPFMRNANNLSVEHLDLLYNRGIKLIDRLGEDKVAEIMETTSINKPFYSDELDTIVMGNDELRERINTLNEMNAKSVTPNWELPIICGILFIMIMPFLSIIIMMEERYFSLYNDLFFVRALIWAIICNTFIPPLEFIMTPIMDLFLYLSCEEYIP